MLGSRLPSEGGVLTNNDLAFAVPFLDTSREQQLETWAPSLLDAGYRCVHVGKWYIIPVPGDRPSKFGFDGPDWSGYGKTWLEPDFHRYRTALGRSAEVELEEGLEANQPFPSSFSPISARLAGPVEGSLPYFVAETAIDELRRLAADPDNHPFFSFCVASSSSANFGDRGIFTPR